MLPKVATHIIHTTSRAAAAAQNQTYNFRNVLQLHTSGPTTGPTSLSPWNNGTGSSNWGNNGPGPGGAKHTGSRFYGGYTGPIRSVSQANAVTSSDGNAGYSDETDEIPTRRVAFTPTKRTRLRSHSLSLSVQDRLERGETLGVLKTVQMHARSKHAFAPTPSVENAVSSLVETTRPTLVRRNSTSSPPENSDAASHPQSSAPAAVRHHSTTATVSSQDASSGSPLPPSTSSQTVTNSGSRGGNEVESPESQDYLVLRQARDSRDPVQASQAVLEFRKNAVTPSAREFNMALLALFESRQSGDPLQLFLETYNDMIRHSLLPDHLTYSVLIQAFLERDMEVSKTIRTIEARIKRRTVTGSMEISDTATDELRIKDLKAENNFGSAMSLFEALLGTVPPPHIHRIQPQVYHMLLRSAALHNSLPSAIHVFAQLEARKDLPPNAFAYKYLLHAYANAFDLQGAEVVFNDYRQKVADGVLKWTDKLVVQDHRRICVQLYNQMIDVYFKVGRPEMAIALLESMIASPAPAEFGPQDIPSPASSTFTTIIAGFVESGDLETAQKWFERLLQQDASTTDPYQTLASGQAMRPDFAAWEVMLHALAQDNSLASLDSLNRLFLILKADANVNLRVVDQCIIFSANMKHITGADDEVAIRLLEFLRNEVLDLEFINTSQAVRYKRLDMVKGLYKAYLGRGDIESAIAVINAVIQRAVDKDIRASNRNIPVMQTLVLELQADVYAQHMNTEAMDWDICLALSRAADLVQVGLQSQFLPSLLHSYGVARVTDAGNAIIARMSLRDWELLLFNSLHVDAAQQQDGLATPSLAVVLQDMAQFGVEFDKLQSNLVQSVLNHVITVVGPQEAFVFIKSLGPSFAAIVGEPEQRSPVFEAAVAEVSPGASTLPSPVLSHVVPVRLRVDSNQTKAIDEILTRTLRKRPAQGKSSHELVLNAYERLCAGLDRGKAPAPATIGRLIQALGRLNEMKKVQNVYERSQEVLRALEMNKKWQSDSWFFVEDSMVIAMAHSGDIEAAHLHRNRILEQGGHLTADAYGALILYVKDTTDDATNAMSLFQESQAHSVAPNQYLYNNIISKLSKARKADSALELFNQMKANNVFPSSITYGAVIGACARVGDVQSAESLFEEMVQAKNFRPRVPPFNTMMQLYTTTKPDRERALHYYEEMLKASVRPTAHTYKLLMDAYGSIEPVQVPEMEQVFETLKRDPSVEVQGTHYASLINAYGCVQKDLEKAISIFNSIYRTAGSPTLSTLSSPTTEASLSSFSSPSSAPGPDAVVFEAIINVLVTHRRTDLLPEYIQKMNASGVHMTAYIANFLIKGYSVMGDLPRAREIFESLADPAVGVAAPNNHAPHDPSIALGVDPMAPVYREPSTWEAMVRAELGAGNHAEALDLLERLKARRYPEAVYNRISGIMVDRSMLPS